MNKKQRNSNIVYSTDPDFVYDDENEIVETPEPARQKLTIRLDRKQRRGKQVTLIEGFTGSDDDLKALSKILKTKCGVGGSAKDGVIIIQGDFRKKAEQILSDMGYKCKISGA
ncbi:MAG: translation initiation factor [Chlorobi bacterium]|nr:translation initiation factor [Chlorobiota bacterium]